MRCSQPGHISRDCPDGGGGGDRNCYKCGKPGHISRDCPDGDGGAGEGCYKCGVKGHISVECPLNNDNKGAEFDPDAPQLPKEEASFELSGALAAETNKFNGVSLLHNEPPEVRKRSRGGLEGV